MAPYQICPVRNSQGVTKASTHPLLWNDEYILLLEYKTIFYNIKPEDVLIIRNTVKCEFIIYILIYQLSKKKKKMLTIKKKQ
jgi:hypothetical protein